nr:hypothetical protein [Spirochaetota bacterium]
MKFSLLLWALGLKLKSASKKSGPFRARLAEQDMVVQIRTADGRGGGSYSLKGGGLTSTGGFPPSPDLPWV